MQIFATDHPTVTKTPERPVPSGPWRRFYDRLQRVIMPRLRHAEYVYEETLLAYLDRNSYWLEAGCGRGVLPAWLPGRAANLIERGGKLFGIDLDAASVRDNQMISRKLIGDLQATPFRSGSFGLVTSHFVMEHLEEPARFLREIYRIMKPGGILIFHTPNIRHYQIFIASLTPQWAKNVLVKFLEGREEEDVFPAHYRLNTPGAVEREARGAGFRVKELKLVHSGPQFIKLGPVVFLELLITRVLEWPACRSFRSNIVAVLEKPAEAGGRSGGGRQ